MKIIGAVLDRVAAAGPYAVTRPLRLAELELGGPGPGELLVRIDAAGLCHSDLSVVNGDRPRPLPMLLGHEAAATVVRAGDGPTAFVPGDRVVLTFLAPCGACAACDTGRAYLCGPAARANGGGALLRGGPRLAERGRKVLHHLGVSAFADHAVVDARSAVRIDADIPVEVAALFGCAVLTGVGAILNTAAVRPGQSVAVFGLGGVGMSAVMGARVAGAHPLVAIDPLPAKRALAESLGATASATPEDAAALIAALTPDGVDVAIETVGKAAVIGSAYRATARGGTTVVVGLANPAEQLAIPAVSLVADAKTLVGSYMGSAIPARDVPAYVRLWREGQLPVERLLSSVSPLADVNHLLDELAAGTVLRQVMTP
jgi:alcohol dehydrogenase